MLCREAVRLMGGEPGVTQQKSVLDWGGGSAGYHGTVSWADQPPRRGFVRLLRERFARHVIMINEFRTSMVRAQYTPSLTSPMTCPFQMCAKFGRRSLRRNQGAAAGRRGLRCPGLQ